MLNEYCCLNALVPEGLPRKARRFNAGEPTRYRTSPDGTTETGISRPFGTWLGPALPGSKLPGYFRWFLRNHVT